MVMHDRQSTMAKQYTSFAGHFGGHADQVLRCRAHLPVWQVYGYPRCTGRRHWASIRPLWPQQTPWSSILAQKINLWRSEIAVSKLVLKGTNGPSTQLGKATSCIERSKATIKAKDLSYLLNCQTLTMDNNQWSYWLPTKLIIQWTLMSVHRSYPV